MSVLYRYALYILFGFVFGGILFSYHIPKIIKSVDVTKESDDKNPGAANAVKYSGISVGLLCLLCDFAKGFIPVAVAVRNLDPEKIAFAAVVAAPVLGHAWAPFYKIKGGKAIAASFGSLVALIRVSYICVVLAALYIFFSVVVTINPHEKRTVVVFALTAAASLSSALFNHHWAIAAGCTIISAVVVYKNIIDPRFVWKHASSCDSEEKLKTVENS